MMPPSDTEAKSSPQADPVDNRRYYDEFSSSYERHRHHGYHAFIDDLETETVRRYLTPSMHILEAGCGTGLVLSRLRPHAARAVGVDLSRGMLTKARARNLDVVEGSVTALPFADASFDLVCSFKVLAHVKDIELAMREMARVLRPGGYMCAEFYNEHSLRYLIKRLKSPTPTSSEFHDEAVYTRYDTLPRIRGYLPPSMTVDGVYGIRVVTPLPLFHRLPFVAPVLQSVERLAAAAPLFRHLGGFMLVVAKKATSP